MATAHTAWPPSPDKQIRAAPEPTFGPLLRRHRLAAGLTQEDLAERAGLSIRGISDLERGERRLPRRHTVLRLASALTLSSSESSAFESAALIAPIPPPFRPSNIPTPPTRLIGRAGEVTDVAARLMSEDVRLVTLTGAGGVGKTRLAQEVALTLLHSFAGRVWQVELAHVYDADLVAGAIAGVLGLAEIPGTSVEESLVNHLRQTPALLLFDNFEHLPAASLLVAHLHGSCPTLRILVTSRAPLRLRGEYQQLVRPLSMPDPGRLPSPNELGRYPAVSLFVERAHAVESSFSLSSVNAATVATICRRLDGLPLALELAASRIKMFPPKALLAQLERQLLRFTGGVRDIPERQRTLQETAAWSYELLTPLEKVLFRRLAVFVGGCTMAAVEFVCRISDDMGEQLLESVSALLDKNLLHQLTPADGGEEDESRFGMLGTIREYGLERLAAMGELERSRERHAAYFLPMMDSENLPVTGVPRRPWVAKLNLDHLNVCAALEYRRGAKQERDVRRMSEDSP